MIVTQQTKIIRADTKQNIDCMKLLVEVYGADVNVASRGGFSPLMNAVDQEYIPGIIYLIQKGAGEGNDLEMVKQHAQNKKRSDLLIYLDGHVPETEDKKKKIFKRLLNRRG